MAPHPQVLISYAIEDLDFVSMLRARIGPLGWKYVFDISSVARHHFEADSLKASIEDTLKEADIAIMVISPDYLTSQWTNDIEMPKLLERSDEGGLRVLPIIARPSAWTHTPLAYHQVLPRYGRPFSELSEVEKEEAWSELYEVLEAELHRLTEGMASYQMLAQHPKRVGPKAEPADERGEDAEQSEAGTSPEDSRSKFFISHAKEDGDFAENLKSRMRENKFDGWIDTDVLEAGVDWRSEIDEAILNSRALILVLSPDSKSSEYVTYEWAFALGSGLRIVPLMVRDTPIHPRLEIFQYLDFTNRRARPWKRLFALLGDVSEIPHDDI